MFPDFRELLSELNAHRVKYLVVGGQAVSIHAQPRFTKDLDILIGADPENAKAAYAALAKFGAPLEGLKPADLVEPGNFFRMGTPPVLVDVLSSIAGVEFEQAWERRVEVSIDDALTIQVISREDLRTAKLAAGRPQDLADAAELERSLEAQHRPDIAQESSQPIEEMQRQSGEKWLKRRSHEPSQSPGEPDEKPKTRDRGRAHEPDNDPE